MVAEATGLLSCWIGGGSGVDAVVLRARFAGAGASSLVALETGSVASEASLRFERLSWGVAVVAMVAQLFDLMRI